MLKLVDLYGCVRIRETSIVAAVGGKPSSRRRFGKLITYLLFYIFFLFFLDPGCASLQRLRIGNNNKSFHEHNLMRELRQLRRDVDITS